MYIVPEDLPTDITLLGGNLREIHSFYHSLVNYWDKVEACQSYTDIVESLSESDIVEGLSALPLPVM